MQHMVQAGAGETVLPFSQGIQELYGTLVQVDIEGENLFIEPIEDTFTYDGLGLRADILSSDIAAKPLLRAVQAARFPRSPMIAVKTAEGLNRFAHKYFAPIGAAALNFVQTEVAVEMPVEDYIGIYLPRDQMALGSSDMFVHDMRHAVVAMTFPGSLTRVYTQIAKEVPKIADLDLARAREFAIIIGTVFDRNVAFGLDSANPKGDTLVGVSLLNELLGELYQSARVREDHHEFLGIAQKIITDSGLEIKDGNCVPEEIEISREHYALVHDILRERPQRRLRFGVRRTIHALQRDYRVYGRS